MFKTKVKTGNLITIKNQNIFDSTIDRTKSCYVIIPHVCNNVNAFGAGFAGAISSVYPIVKHNFHLLGTKARLGYTQFIDTYINKQTNNKIIVANMIAQNGIINSKNPRPLNYYALCVCMNSINKHINDLYANDPSLKIEIHCPKFGSGLAGGNWKFIEDLISDIWSGHDVFIYQK